MDKIKSYFAVMLAILCLVLSGCGSGDIKTEPMQSETPANNGSETGTLQDDMILKMLSDEEMQELYAAAEPALTIAGTPDYSDISTEELLKMANEPYRDENGLTVLDRLGENDVFHSEEEAEAWTGASGKEDGWTEFDVSVYETEGTLEYPTSEIQPNEGDTGKSDIPEEIAALIPFGIKDSDTYMEDDASRMLIMPGRTEKDFKEAVRLAETAGFIGGNTYSIKGMTIYEAEKNKTVLTIMLSESSLMISLE